MVSRSTAIRLVITAGMVLTLVFVIPWLSVQALEFCIGMTVAVVFKLIELSRFANWSLILASIGFWTLFFALPNDLNRWVGLGIPVGLLVLGAAGLSMKPSSIWTALGGASYSVYLVQVLTIPMILYPLMDILSLPIDGLLLFCLALTATQVIGLAFHVFVDEPLRTWMGARRGMTRI